MVRIALETCATVEEAVALFQSVRIWFPVEVNHILLADKTGSSAVIEFDKARNVAVFTSGSPAMILTNTAYQEGKEYLIENCWRYRKASRMLKRGVRREDDVKRP